MLNYNMLSKTNGVTHMSRFVPFKKETLCLIKKKSNILINESES